jgi:hypothetical protein
MRKHQRIAVMGREDNAAQDEVNDEDDDEGGQEERTPLHDKSDLSI